VGDWGKSRSVVGERPPRRVCSVLYDKLRINCERHDQFYCELILGVNKS
jgi:hypothetical protein